MKIEEKILEKSQVQRAESKELWAISLIAIDFSQRKTASKPGLQPIKMWLKTDSDNNFSYHQLKQTAIDKKQFQQFFNKYNSFNSYFGGWEASVLAIRAAGTVFNN